MNRGLSSALIGFVFLCFVSGCESPDNSKKSSSGSSNHSSSQPSENQSQIIASNQNQLHDEDISLLDSEVQLTAEEKAALK